MYLVTGIWRSSLHIDPMRLFTDLDTAIKYANDLGRDNTRIYLLSATEPPKLIKQR